MNFENWQNLHLQMYNTDVQYRMDLFTITCIIVSLLLFGIILLVVTCYEKEGELSTLPAVEELSENSSQKTRPRHALPISYLRTLSLPTCEMAMKTMGRKVEETPPPQF